MDIVLRLPQYHPNLNPIELVWADLKNNIAQNHYHSALDEKLNALFFFWVFELRCIDHVRKTENVYWDRDIRFDNIIEPFIINLQVDSDSSYDNEIKSKFDTESMSEYSV